MLPALAAGAVIAAVLLGAIGGLNLAFPAVAYDGSDGLDAVSRAFNYVYAKPWRLGFYTAIAVIYGGVCYIFVRFFAFLLLWSTYRGLRLGAVTQSSHGLPDKVAAIWPQPSFSRLLSYSAATGTWQESTAAILIFLSALVIVGLAASFIISFYFSSNTVIYALMRNQVDETPLETVYAETAETKKQPAGAQQPSQ
jgi:small-conductance mechanosensitive channel